MAISDTQKIDALYKKFGFGVAKTDTSTNKSPSNEAIASPLLVRGDKVWNESDLIPSTPPSATNAQVKVRTHAGDGRIAATADSTVVPSSRTWLTGVINWIPPQFGSGYSVKVYADTAGAANPEATGTLLAPDGSNADAYIFDYTSGVLNFSDTNLPAALTGKSIFVVGCTYQGTIGVKNNSGLGGGLTASNGSLTTTATNSDLTLSGNGTGVVVIDDSTQVNGTLTATGTVTAPTFVGNVTSGGTSAFTDVTVSGTETVGTLSVTGDSTLKDTIVDGTLDVTGVSTLATVTATNATVDSLVVNGTSDLKGATTIGTAGTNANLLVNGGVVATGNVVVQGNFTVSGTQTIIETEILKVADNIITLNNGIGVGTSPTENAGLEVDRGTEGVMTVIRWNETTDKVEIQQGGSLLEVATVANITAATNTLQSELDATQAATGLETTGALAAFTGANYISADTTLRSAVVGLDSNLNRVEDGVGVFGDLTTTSKVVVGAINELDAEVGNTVLTTAATTVKAAINEVDAHADNLYTVLGVTADASVTGFDGLNYVATNSTVKAAITTLDAQLRTTTDQVDGNIGTLTNLTTTSKTTLVSAINEVDGHTNSIYTVMGVTTDATQTDFTGLNYVGNNVSLSGAITALDTQLKSTTSQVDGQIGALNTLTTTTNSTLVGAINEVDTHANSLYTVLGVTTDATTTGLALLNYVTDNATVIDAIADLDTQVKVLADRASGDTGDMSTLTTTAKSTIVGAINEVDAHANNIYSLLGETVDASATAFLTSNYLAAKTTVHSALVELDTTIKTRGDNIAGASGLTGDAYVADNSTNYIAAATSLFDADKKLDAQLKTTTLQVDGKIGDLTSLNTTAKTTLVAALNEVDTHTNSIYTALGVSQDGTATDFTGKNYVASDVTVVAAISTLDATLKTRGDNINTAVGITGDTFSISASNTATDFTAVLAGTETSVTNALTVIANKLVTEQQARLDGDVSVTSAVTTETNRAKAAEGVLTSLTTTAKSTLVAAINEVDSDLANEISRAQLAETAIITDLDDEILARTNANTALTTRVNNISTGVGLTSDGFVANTSAHYIAAATSVVDATNKLDTALYTVSTDISSTAVGKGSSLVGFKGYTEADISVVNPAIELTAGTLESALTSVISTVNLKIHEIENKYVKGEIAAIDATDTYTIAHNLDTNFVDVSVQVYDTEFTVWRFDLVVVEVIDVNTVKISLASGIPAQIRYVIHGY